MEQSKEPFSLDRSPATFEHYQDSAFQEFYEWGMLNVTDSAASSYDLTPLAPESEQNLDGPETSDPNKPSLSINLVGEADAEYSPFGPITNIHQNRIITSISFSGLVHGSPKEPLFQQPDTAEAQLSCGLSRRWLEEYEESAPPGGINQMYYTHLLRNLVETITEKSYTYHWLMRESNHLYRLLDRPGVEPPEIDLTQNPEHRNRLIAEAAKASPPAEQASIKNSFNSWDEQLSSIHNLAYAVAEDVHQVFCSCSFDQRPQTEMVDPAAFFSDN